jgi:hypothetical protein
LLVNGGSLMVAMLLLILQSAVNDGTQEGGEYGPADRA